MASEIHGGVCERIDDPATALHQLWASVCVDAGDGSHGGWPTILATVAGCHPPAESPLEAAVWHQPLR